MRITILQGAFLPVPAIRGGAIEKAWQVLGEAFVKAGHDVTHISRLCDGLPEQESIEGVRHLRIPGADATKYSYLLKLREISYVLRARRILPEADILVTHAFWAPLFFPAEKFGKIYVHVGRYPKGQLRLYKKASCLQTPSEFVSVAAAKELKDGSERVRTIPYPLPFSLPESGFPRLENRPKRVLYAGRIHPEKGVLNLVGAWKKLPESFRNEWGLRIIGPWRQDQGGGGSSFFEQLKKEVDSSIEFLEPIFSEKELMEEYKKARIFVYPSIASKGETFGLAVLEAMSCGCVPLVSSLPCFDDFIRPGENGYRFDERTNFPEDTLKKCLQSLLSDSSDSGVGQNAFETAKDYRVDGVAARFIADFEALLGRKNSSCPPKNILGSVG